MLELKHIGVMLSHLGVVWGGPGALFGHLGVLWGIFGHSLGHSLGLLHDHWGILSQLFRKSLLTIELSQVRVEA